MHDDHERGSRDVEPYPGASAGTEELLRALCDEPAPRIAPRVLVAVAHPDDEILGASRLLCRLRASVTVLYVADGDAPPAADPTASSAVRCREAEAALRLIRVGPERLVRFGIGDQRAGHSLVEASRRMQKVLAGLLPEVVVTHPYEGGHPDHDATAFAVHAALLLLSPGEPAPALLELASYHERDGAMFTGGFLPRQGAAAARVIELSQRERALKQRLLQCHASQAEVWRWFQTDYELLRVAPAYDFREPAHTALYYERFDWGMTGALWQQRARAALEALGLD